jgi:putative transposase
MPTKQFSDEQIVRILEEAEQGNCTVVELCRKHQISEGSYYAWKKKFKGLPVKEVKRLKELEQENTRLKRVLAETMLEKEVLKEIVKKL